jgi:hypothetical protein
VLELIQKIQGDARDYAVTADIILTDPPFDMPGEEVAEILNRYKCEHVILIASMRQVFGFVRATRHSHFHFDIVLDHVVPKKSKAMHQPNYVHSNVFYFSSDGSTKFSRSRGKRSDTLDGKSFWPTIVRAPRNRLAVQYSKNIAAITDILDAFDFDVVCDPFAGSGTTGYAAAQLGKRSILITL